MDTLSDFLIRIKNASLAGNKNLVVSYSKIKENLSKILKKQGFLEQTETTGDKKDRKISLSLVAKNGKVVPVEVKMISKPGRRVYVSAKDLKSYRGQAVYIVTTPVGLMTSREAIKENIGGEIICKII